MNHIPIYDAAVLVLASGRIAYAITADEIFKPLREVVFRRSAPGSAVDEEGHPYRLIQVWRNNAEERARGWGKWSEDFDPTMGPRKIGFWGSLFECFYCMSFWTSLAAFGAYLAYPIETIAFLALFAIWGLANLFAKVLH